MLTVCLAMLDTQEEKDRFEKLVGDYQDRLFALACKILNNNALAEEALWDAFFKIANNFQKINNLPVYKIEAFLVITVRRTCYSIYNREKKHSSNVNLDDYREIPDDMTNDDFGKYDKANLENAIKKLDEKHSSVIACFYYYGMSASEIAKVMNVSRTAVYKYLNKAKELLRKELEGESNEQHEQ